MDLNYVLTDYFVADRIASRLRDAGALQRGTGSLIVAIIGRGADGISRLTSAIARWADGTAESHTGAIRRATIR